MVFFFTSLFYLQLQFLCNITSKVWITPSYTFTFNTVCFVIKMYWVADRERCKHDSHVIWWSSENPGRAHDAQTPETAFVSTFRLQSYQTEEKEKHKYSVERDGSDDYVSYMFYFILLSVHSNNNNIQYIIMAPLLAKGPCYSVPLLAPVRSPWFTGWVYVSYATAQVLI